MNELKKVIDELIYEAAVGKNSFKIGDLVKIRPDVLGRHSSSIPAHAGFSKNDFSWRDTLRILAGKMGKIVKTSPNSKMVNVEYEEPWESKDEYNRVYKINTIGIDYTELVPYADDPSVEEGVGYVYDKDMKKDPKHIRGKRWTVKYENEKNLGENRHTPKSFVNESEIRNVIQELLKEMWVGFKEEKIAEEENKKWIIKNGLGHEIGEIETSSDPIATYAVKVNVSSETLRKAGYKAVEKNEQIKKKVAETRETSDKNYIIFGKSGPVVTYYANSLSQGERMVQFGQSLAYRFKTLEQVRNKILKLKQKYKGITDWDYEIVSNPHPDVYVQPLISSQNKGHTVSRPFKKGEEWFVRYAIDGKTDEGKSYYTDDKKDALDTYAYMIKYAEEQNKKQS